VVHDKRIGEPVLNPKVFLQRSLLIPNAIASQLPKTSRIFIFIEIYSDILVLCIQVEGSSCPLVLIYYIHMHQLLQLEPDSGIAYLYQGYCALRLEDRALARKVLTKASGYKKEKKEARRLLAWLNKG
jgi:hypothetical protein